MDDLEAEARYDRLMADLARLQALLERHDERRWARSVAAARSELAAGDAHGLTRLLGAFGGMGSLADLVIHPANGHRVDADEASAVNAELARLRSSTYEDASELLRLQRRDG